MSKKKRKPRRQPRKPSKQGPSGLGFVLGAVGFGLLCVAAGVAIIIFGGGYERAGAEIAEKDVRSTGYWMIGLGVGAMILTAIIYRWKR